MSNEPIGRTELLDALHRIGRQYSTATVLFHSVVAGLFRLNATDWKCAELLTQTGPITAGELAEQSGLTTGAITGVVDRLEQARFVRREQDPRDRRRVIIRPIPEREQEVLQLLQPFGQRVAEVSARYSDRELALILEFLSHSVQVLREEAARLQEEATEEA
jgi:DNA-binding MarR family transcriptional regulator